jgi:hypothetical protein
MALGFPPRFKQSRVYPLQETELIALTKSALNALGWSYEVQSETEIHARPASSPLTWGEELTLMIGPGGTIQAESRCAGARFQVFDFGKNRQNVELFFKRLEQLKAS